ncbi:MAG: hypothetical protein C4297_03985 [Gemmataceae bacterium]
MHRLDRTVAQSVQNLVRMLMQSQARTRDLQLFSLALLVAGAFLSWILLRKIDAWPYGLALMVITSILGLIGLAFPEMMRVPWAVFTLLTYPVGWLVSHLLLACAYLGVVTPMALVLRISGYDPLCRRFEPGRDSYWTPRCQVTDVERYLRQY